MSILTMSKRRKLPLLYEAAGNFLDRGHDDEALAEQWAEFEEFCRDEAAWLDDYALYAVLRRAFNTGAWTEWPEPLRRRDPQALAQAAAEARARSARIEQVLQFAFAQQWDQLREAAAQNARSGSWAMWRSSSIWIRPMCGFTRRSSSSTRT